MNELDAVASALGSIKLAGDMAKALVDIRDGAKFQEKAIELQRAILDAQDSALIAKQSQSTLIDQISDLKKELAEVENWKAERDRYELVQFPSGAYAYRLKPNASPSETKHCLCANCCNKGIKSILHESLQRSDKFKYCPSCNEGIAELPDDGRRSPTKRRNPWAA